LVEAKGHDGKSTAKQTLDLLKSRFDIEQNMILVAGVDTTNPALLGSRRLNTGDDDEDRCQMHVANLAYGHATGMKTRT
jgi:hypothetical protein